jgi:type I restriction enzyme S subunit
MADEWKNERLSDLCSEIADCPHSTPLWTDSGVLVLRSQNIRNGRLDLSAKSYTDEAHFEQRSRRARLRGGDLVITREAPMGEVCLIPDGLRCCLGQRMVMLRPDPKKCHSRFLLYSIQSRVVQDEIKVNEGTGSTVSNLRIPLLEALPIPHPPLAEQTAIAAVLGALDDKIELNRRMNATLEAMARALFQSWFVDFDPVRAKLDGRKPIGLDETTAALFPDSFQESSLGHIPKGWEVQTADEVSTVGIGKTPPRMEHHWFTENPTDVPWMSIRDLGNAGVFISHTSEFLTAEAVEKFRVKRIPDNTVVLSFKLTMGRVAITDGEMLSNEAIAHFRLNSETTFGSAYLYCYLKGFGYDQLGSTSSIATAINSDMVRGMRVLVPPKGLAEAFERTVKPLFTQMKNIQKQSRTLATLRDTLLPKLLSGELRVVEAEKEGCV